MSLSNVVPRLSAAERAREPRSLGVVAWFDGWGQAQGWPPRTYPRLMTVAESRHWREGWAEGKAATLQYREQDETAREGTTPWKN
jgi:hypothetical protein